MKPLAIIPTYVRGDEDLTLLAACLASFRATADGKADLVIVDDGSPGERTGLQTLVEMFGGTLERSEIDLVLKRTNDGFAKTVNVGLKRALEQHRDAILVNADIEFGLTKEWVDLMVNQKGKNGEPASIVGALLLYPHHTIQHAGVFFCSPPDEPVLTGTDGYVPLAELAPEIHRLVGYSRRDDRIYRCATKAGMRTARSGRQVGGYPFEVAQRPYRGRMLELSSAGGQTRVTPNHHLPIRWNECALASHAVYLMRRGNDWRIGHTKVQHGNAFGPRLRMDQQGAEALWIISLHATKAEAMEAEALEAWSYGVPMMQFRLGPTAGISQESQDYIWQMLDSEAGARELLVEAGLDPGLPLLRGRERGVVGRRSGHVIAAANLMPGYMQLRTDGGGASPRLCDFELTAHDYDGPVFSLDVPPYHHYISGGVVVHNSMLYREFGHIYNHGPHNLPEALNARECPVTGALQFIRWECLNDIGLYDETFKMGWEDVDFCVRAWQAGRSCVYQPGVRAIHHESAFRGQAAKGSKLERWQHDSWLRFVQKHATTNFAEFVPNLS